MWTDICGYWTRPCELLRVTGSGRLLPGQPGGQDQFFVQLEPHGVIRVDEWPCQPGNFAGLHFIQRRGQFRRLTVQARQLRGDRRDDRRHPPVHVVKAGQHPGVVFGVPVIVGLAFPELPVRDQRLEIGVY